MNVQSQKTLADKLRTVRTAALDQSPVRGLTHNYYRYPARFSPQFVRSVIEQFSSPGDVVLDPFMGGGTTIVEGMALGRQMVGTDINSLSVFVTRAKTTLLTDRESASIRKWATVVVPELRCTGAAKATPPANSRVPRNMTLPRARWLRKLIEQALVAANEELPTCASRRFARCVLLNVGQWSLNGRRHPVTVGQLRERIATRTLEMLIAHDSLADTIAAMARPVSKPILRLMDAESLASRTTTETAGSVKLVVTSPPYPGIHMLYHRWQVDGRKESDAPYWIAGCNDGCGTAYYNFADRRREAESNYFAKAERAFAAVRELMRPKAALVQMIAFSNPERQLSRYLRTMERSGFQEVKNGQTRRLWRDVPGRSWHASTRGALSSSHEVVLVHRPS